MRGPRSRTNSLIRRLRRQNTDTESALWYSLRNRALNGHKFVRQAPIGVYAVDFLCREKRLIIEADGSQHYDSSSDETRDVWLALQGYAVLRISNRVILKQREAALETIVAALEGRLEPVKGYEFSYRLPSR